MERNLLHFSRFDFKKEIQKQSVVGIIQNLFGISEATVEDYFNINIKASPYLNETDSFAKVQAVMPKNIDTKKGEGPLCARKTIFDFFGNHPSSGLSPGLKSKFQY